ncbi:hypothetical protein KQ874_01820 [Mycoplasma sp. ES3157-GEN-MYC]|uniref:MAG0920 family protein n=1 Tax=Mycoplasma miroungigenitalium TaxID=754515 RepID=UPI001C1022C2|nr:hypothetical protein [Mycoplasma miroungigenitalium]MBU4690426.1 hypothetical protein [Mycoplasma miroungigenitalium]
MWAFYSLAIFYAILTTILWFVFKFRLLSKTRYDISYINYNKLKAKSYLLGKIKLPSKVFQLFRQNIHKILKFLFISLCCLVLLLIGYIAAEFALYFKFKLKFYWFELELILISLPIFLLIYILWTLISSIHKGFTVKKQIDIWNNQNKNIEIEWNKKIDLDDYERFKNIILNETFTLGFSIVTNHIENFVKIKYTKETKSFYNNGNLDSDELIYFLLFDYDKTKINSSYYTYEHYIQLIDEISMLNIKQI